MGALQVDFSNMRPFGWGTLPVATLFDGVEDDSMVIITFFMMVYYTYVQLFEFSLSPLMQLMLKVSL